jgi:hypothetical protein
VLQYLEKEAAPRDRTAALPSADGSPNTAFKSDMPAPELASREQRACAAIGLDPADVAFQECMNSLADVVTARALNQAYTN